MMIEERLDAIERAVADLVDKPDPTTSFYNECRMKVVGSLCEHGRGFMCSRPCMYANPPIPIPTTFVEGKK